MAIAVTSKAVDGGWWVVDGEEKHVRAVVARSPDRATLTDRRSPRAQGDLRSEEWQGQETMPQRRSFCTIHHPPSTIHYTKGGASEGGGLMRYAVPFAAGSETAEVLSLLALLSIPALVLLNGVFVAAEFALVAVRRTRV